VAKRLKQKERREKEREEKKKEDQKKRYEKYLRSFQVHKSLFSPEPVIGLSGFFMILVGGGELPCKNTRFYCHSPTQPWQL